MRKEDNYGLSIVFRDSAARDQAISYLSPRHRDLVISSQGDNSLKAVMTDERLKEAREYAVQQNINILRNRVNQLGVAEPLVQRQGADRIVVELPGIQDTARAKEILARPRPSSSVWSILTWTSPPPPLAACRATRK